MASYFLCINIKLRKMKKTGKILLFLLIITLPTSLLAQSRIDSLRFQCMLSIESMQAKGTTEVFGRGADLTSLTSGGIGINIQLIPKITKKSAIAFGLTLGGFNQQSVKYALEKDYFQLANDFTLQNTQGNFLYKFTLAYVFRQPLTKKYLFETQMGINFTGLAFMLNKSAIYTDRIGSIFIKEKSYTQSLTAPIGLNFGLAISRLVHDKNFIRLGISYYHAPHTIFYSDYTFYAANTAIEEVKGKYTQTASHLSLTLGYVFSAKKKR
jgi:hypothetical protein